MQLRWSHAVVYVRDADVMLDFYTNVLGFEVTDRGPIGDDGGPEIVFLSQVDTDHHQIAFLNIRKGEEASNSVNHFAFRVASLDDVKTMHQRVTNDARVANVNPMTHGNAWSVYFADPEGNGIEVFCDTPWHVQQPQGQTWDTSLPNEDIVEWTRETFHGEPEFGPIEDFYRRRSEALER